MSGMFSSYRLSGVAGQASLGLSEGDTDLAQMVLVVRRDLVELIPERPHTGLAMHPLQVPVLTSRPGFLVEGPEDPTPLAQDSPDALGHHRLGVRQVVQDLEVPESL